MRLSGCMRISLRSRVVFCIWHAGRWFFIFCLYFSRIFLFLQNPWLPYAGSARVLLAQYPWPRAPTACWILFPARNAGLHLFLLAQKKPAHKLATGNLCYKIFKWSKRKRFEWRGELHNKFIKIIPFIVHSILLRSSWVFCEAKCIEGSFRHVHRSFVLRLEVFSAALPELVEG